MLCHSGSIPQTPITQAGTLRSSLGLRAQPGGRLDAKQTQRNHACWNV